MRKILPKLLIIFIIIAIAFAVLSAGCKQDANIEEPDNTIVNIEETNEEEEISEEESKEKIEEAGEKQGAEIETARIKSISIEEVLEIIENNENYIIVDVRTEEEYSGGHIERAVLIPVQELEERIEELPGDESIIVYCRSGGRSRNAAEILVDNGFIRVYDMGGINAWIDRGYPVVVEG